MFFKARAGDPCLRTAHAWPTPCHASGSDAASDVCTTHSASFMSCMIGGMTWQPMERLAQAVLCSICPPNPVAGCSPGCQAARQPHARSGPMRARRVQVSDQYNLKWRWDWIIADFWRAPPPTRRPARPATPPLLPRLQQGCIRVCAGFAYPGIGAGLPRPRPGRAQARAEPVLPVHRLRPVPPQLQLHALRVQRAGRRARGPGPAPPRSAASPGWP